jgi:succinate dehydrogenase/fumarate reductase cytochrome b subunit
MENRTKTLEDAYNDLSSSFFTKTYTFDTQNGRIIIYGIYGFFLLLILVALLLEFLFKKKRTSKCLKGSLTVMWVAFAFIALTFALILNIVIPVASAMSEFGNMIEPIIFNSSFYSNLEWPDETFKSTVASCINNQVDADSLLFS